MSIRDVIFVLPLALYHGVSIRKKHWVKTFFLSIVILLISYLNFFVFPHQMNTHIIPYRNAEFDYTIALYYHFPSIIYMDDSLNVSVYSEMLLSRMEERGINVEDYLLAYEATGLEGRLNIVVLSDIEKLWLTEYNNIVYGEPPTRDEALISSAILISGSVEVGESSIVLGNETIPYSGIVMVSSGDVVIDYRLYTRVYSDHPRYIPFYQGKPVDAYVMYIKTVDDVEKNDLFNIIIEIVDELNQTGVIKFHEMITREDLILSVESSITSREELLSQLEEYFASEYLNPLSPFTISSIGGLVIYIVYLVKISIDIVREDLDIIALIYSIGGSDRHVSLYSLLTVTVFSAPSVLLAFLVSLYWIRAIYGVFLPYTLIFEWLAPYIFIPLVAVLVGSSVLSVLYVRRVGLAHILSLEF